MTTTETKGCCWRPWTEGCCCLDSNSGWFLVLFFSCCFCSLWIVQVCSTGRWRIMMRKLVLMTEPPTPFCPKPTKIFKHQNNHQISKMISGETHHGVITSVESLNTELSPTCYSPQCWGRFWWHIAIRVTVLEFHRGKELLPVEQWQQWTTAKKRNAYCSCDVTQVSRRLASPICLRTETCERVFLAKRSTVATLPGTSTHASPT